MLTALFFLGIAFVSFFLFQKRNRPQRLPLGQFQWAKTIHHQGKQFYMEEVRFPDYQTAITAYVKLMPIVRQWDKLCTEHFDYFDFCTATFQFEHSSVLIFRIIDKIRLVQSDHPIPLAEFEQLIAIFAYGE